MMNAHWFDDGAALSETIRSMRTAVHSLGGSLIIERAPLNIKESIDVWDYAASRWK